MIGGTKDTTTTSEETANKRNTTNIKKESMKTVLTILKISRNTDLSNRRRTTSEDNKEGCSDVKIERRVVRNAIKATRMENTKHQNKNTAVIIAVRKRMENSCLFVKKAIEKNKPARVPLVAAIPVITSRNKSSIEANTPMIVKPTTKNSTQAAAHEAIIDL